MTLRRALARLSDDRDSVRAARDVVAYLDRHRGELLDPAKIGLAVGISGTRIEPVLAALFDGLVISCEGDPLHDRCTFAPDTVLSLEVRRFLKSSSGVDVGLQRRVDRFRGTYGR